MARSAIGNNGHRLNDKTAAISNALFYIADIKMENSKESRSNVKSHR